MAAQPELAATHCLQLVPKEESSKTPKATESNLSEVELGSSSFFRVLGTVQSPSNASNTNQIFRSSIISSQQTNSLATHSIQKQTFPNVRLLQHTSSTTNDQQQQT